MTKTRGTHDHLITATEDICCPTARESFYTAKRLAGGRVASKTIHDDGGATWTLTDGSTVTVKPTAAHG